MYRREPEGQRGGQGGWSLAGQTRRKGTTGWSPGLPSLVRSWEFVLKSAGKHRWVLESMCDFYSEKIAWAVLKAVQGGCGAGPPCHPGQRWRQLTCRRGAGQRERRVGWEVFGDGAEGTCC